MQIDLGDGKFAVVKEIDELRSGDRIAVNGAMSLGVDPDGGGLIPGDMDDKMRVALAKRIITDWNLEWPLPSKRPDSLEKLTLGQMSALWNGIDGHLREIQEMPKQDPGVHGSDPTGASSD